MRVYQGDSIVPHDPGPHTLVEVETDSYLEITIPKTESLTTGDKQRLRAFVRKIHSEEKRTKRYHIRMARRYFKSIIPVPNLKLIGEF